MKNLMDFESVRNALSQVVAESDVNNGTEGLSFQAFLYTHEYAYDKERAALQNKITRAVLDGRLEEVLLLQKEMAVCAKPQVIMEWHLLKPIPRIQGTKIIHDGKTKYSIAMDDVEVIYIREDAVALGLLEYSETKQTRKDSRGEDAIVVKMQLTKGLIDIAAPIIDKFENEMKPKRAYVSAVSFRSMQVVGEMKMREGYAKKRRYGFDMI